MIKKRTFFVDIDGTIFKYRPFAHYATTTPEVVHEALDPINQLYDQNHCIVYTTARPEYLRELTIRELAGAGAKYHQLVMGLERGTRYLINDQEDPEVKRAIPMNLLRNQGFTEEHRALLAEIQEEEVQQSLAKMKKEATSLYSRAVTDKYGIIQQILREQNWIEGAWLEFGVFRGTSLRYMSQQAPAGVQVYGFDSFRGFPEDQRTDWKDNFDCQENIPTWIQEEQPENVTLMPGWFEETLPRWIEEHPEPIALLHVDCDLYSSTRTIFTHLKDRLRPGTIIVFDELINYPGFENNELKAFLELIGNLPHQYLYVGNRVADPEFLRTFNYRKTKNKFKMLRGQGYGQEVALRLL